MSLPKAYLTSTKNLAGILDAIKTAQAPKQFTTRFLQSLEFKSTNDRLVIGLLKSLGFLTDGGEPTERYYRFLDQTQSSIVLAEGIKYAYTDLFQVNINAHELTRSDVKNKMRTLSQGQYSESVLDKMSLTFIELCKLADFKTAEATSDKHNETRDDAISVESDVDEKPASQITKKTSLGGLHYNIQIIMPESRDPKVYDALFRSLKEHLL